VEEATLRIADIKQQHAEFYRDIQRSGQKKRGPVNPDKVAKYIEEKLRDRVTFVEFVFQLWCIRNVRCIHTIVIGI